MTEDGTLSILVEPHGYDVRYASNNFHSLERRPATCPDEAALVALLDACGLDSWSIQQTCAELREGRMAIMPVALVLAPLEAIFPLAQTSDASAVDHPQREATRQAIRALFFPHEER
jgi:hypothetical protein